MKGAIVEVFLLAGLFVFLVGTLLVVAHAAMGEAVSNSVITWAGMVIGALIAMVRGSNRGDPPSSGPTAP